MVALSGPPYVAWCKPADPTIEAYTACQREVAPNGAFSVCVILDTLGAEHCSGNNTLSKMARGGGIHFDSIKAPNMEKLNKLRHQRTANTSANQKACAATAARCFSLTSLPG